jgi:hypothetical protein
MQRNNQKKAGPRFTFSNPSAVERKRQIDKQAHRARRAEEEGEGGGGDGEGWRLPPEVEKGGKTEGVPSLCFLLPCSQSSTLLPFLLSSL